MSCLRKTKLAEKSIGRGIEKFHFIKVPFKAKIWNGNALLTWFMKSIVWKAHDTFLWYWTREKKVEFHLNFSSLFAWIKKGCLWKIQKSLEKIVRINEKSLGKVVITEKKSLEKVSSYSISVSRGTKYPLKRRDFHRKRFYILANAVFHRYDIRRWKKFHQLCTQQR